MSDNIGEENFIKLEGKKIVKAHVHGVGCVTLETDTGEFFMIETECVIPSLGLYGMTVTETTKENIVNDYCDRR